MHCARSRHAQPSPGQRPWHSHRPSRVSRYRNSASSLRETRSSRSKAVAGPLHSAEPGGWREGLGLASGSVIEARLPPSISRAALSGSWKWFSSTQPAPGRCG